MRITSETKTATREKILAEARLLFRKKGYSRTTTRDIAKLSRIATGTLFNYFPTKESIGEELFLEGLLASERELLASPTKSKTLNERLFAFMAGTLRHLKPSRDLVAEFVESSMFSLLRVDNERPSLGRRHLEILKRSVLTPSEFESIPPFYQQQYLSAFVGVVVYWLGDQSQSSAGTLAFLDHQVTHLLQTIPLSKSGTPFTVRKKELSDVES